jgi:hypothetical protein
MSNRSEASPRLTAILPDYTVTTYRETLLSDPGFAAIIEPELDYIHADKVADGLDRRADIGQNGSHSFVFLTEISAKDLIENDKKHPIIDFADKIIELAGLKPETGDDL